MTGAVSGYIGGLISGGISESLGVTNNAYTTTLINNYATYGIGRLLGSGEEFDMNKIGEVDTINLVVQDMYQGYLKNRTAMQRGANNAADPADMGKASQPVSSSTRDPFEALDSALSGIFTSFGRGLGQTMADIGGAIKDGAVEAWGGIKSGVAAAWDGVSSAAGMAWDGVKSFGEHTSNLFTEGQFASNEEIESYKRIQKSIANGTALEEGSAAYYRLKNDLDPDSMTSDDFAKWQIAMASEDSYDWYNGDGYGFKEAKFPNYIIGRVNETTVKQVVENNNDNGDTASEKSSDHNQTDNEKAVEIIKGKLDKGEYLSEADIANYYDSARQQSDGNTTLEKELIATISGDPEVFKQAMKLYETLDSTKSSDITHFARDMQASFCKLFNQYTQLVLNDVEGTPNSIGEYYKKLLVGTNSNGTPLIDILKQTSSTQDIFDYMVGKNKVQVIGYGMDVDGIYFNDEAGKDTSNYSGEMMMNKLEQIIKTGEAKDITVRIKVGGGKHDMGVLRREKDEKTGKYNYWLYDNSYRGKKLDYTKYVTSKNISSLYYIKKRGE